MSKLLALSLLLATSAKAVLPSHPEASRCGMTFVICTE